jgi:futalosine hydrolase
MKLLVVAATEFEIVPYMLKNAMADILITGVGSPACIHMLTKRLQQFKYDFVIQAGIAGTFKNSFPLGETFFIKSDLFADLGIYENESFFTLFEKKFADPNTVPYKNGWLENSIENTFNVSTAKSITVNTVTDNFLQTSLFTKKYDPDLESMEGAAFHYVCIQENVSFLQLRSVSNFVGERVKTNWKMKESIINLNENLVRIVNQFNNVQHHTINK